VICIYGTASGEEWLDHGRIMNTTQRLTEQTDDEVVELLRTHITDDEVRDKAIEKVESAFEQGALMGNAPKSIASGAEYSAKLIKQVNGGESRRTTVTQKEVADKYDVTQSTVRTVYTTLL